MVVLLWVTTVVMFYHAIAWFSVTPKAMPIQRGEEFVPAEYHCGRALCHMDCPVTASPVACGGVLIWPRSTKPFSGVCSPLAAR